MTMDEILTPENDPDAWPDNPKFSSNDRFRCSVLMICSGLHGVHTGSAHETGCTREYQWCVKWLRWRVNDGWTPNVIAHMAATENAIREFARRVLMDAEGLEIARAGGR